VFLSGIRGGSTIENQSSPAKRKRTAKKLLITGSCLLVPALGFFLWMSRVDFGCPAYHCEMGMYELIYPFYLALLLAVIGMLLLISGLILYLLSS
jgi:hypothetical protein